MKSNSAHHRDSARRGVALIVVVGVLAILMLMAGTLALISRMGYTMSANYGRTQSMDVVMAAVETHCKDIIYRDKYGRDGYPYNYEAAEAGGWAAGSDPYPPELYQGDDENFDWPGEEWLPGDDSWRLFPDVPYDAATWDAGDYGLRIDLNGDDTYDHMVEWRPFPAMGALPGGEYGSLTGVNIGVRFCAVFNDMGGSRVDINRAGNWPTGSSDWEYSGGDSRLRQNQGLTADEIDLSRVGVSTGDMVSAARDLIYLRWGGKVANLSQLDLAPLASAYLVYPGAPGESGRLPDKPDRLDRDASGEVNDNATLDEFTRYSAIFAKPEHRPFDAHDLDDLFMRRRSDAPAGDRVLSRAADVLYYWNEISNAEFDYFTVNSATTRIAGRAAGAFTATTPGRLWNYSYFNPGPTRRLPAAREIGKNIRKMSPAELADFLLALGPEVKVNGSLLDPTHPVEGAMRRAVIRQTATNITDMIDENSTVTVWTCATDNRTYYGVEGGVPYLAECKLVSPLDPTLGSFAPDQTPHWGKYVKLFNPWNKEIELDRYKLRIPLRHRSMILPGLEYPRARRWIEVTDIAVHNRATFISVPVDAPFLAPDEELVIEFDPGEVIPPRSHYIVADHESTIQKLLMVGTVAGMAGYCTVDPKLQYAQECKGLPGGWPDINATTVFRMLRYEVVSGYQFAPGDEIQTGPGVGPGPIPGQGLPPGPHCRATVVMDERIALTHGLLLVRTWTPGRQISAGDRIYNREDVSVVVSRALTDAEPLYDWFEAPPRSTIHYQWVSDWCDSAADPLDGAAVRERMQPVPGGFLPDPDTGLGKASVIELWQDDTVIQFTSLHEADGLDTPDADDYHLPDAAIYVMGADRCMQIPGDPRPCWYGWNGVDMAQRSWLGGPWGENAWVKRNVERRRSSTDIHDMGMMWFNEDWKTTADERVPTGDRWLRYSSGGFLPGSGLDEDILTSFPPLYLAGGIVDPGGWEYYTGVDGHKTAIMNTGLMPTAGALGYVHTGLPWTTVSFGDYGGNLTEMVHLRNFIDYVAAPREPFEARPGPSNFRIKQRVDVDGAAATNSQPVCAAAADFNEDGCLDLAVSASQSIWIHYGRKGGGFRGRHEIPPTGVEEPASIVSADFDKDGHADLAYVCNTADEVRVRYGDGDGTFGAAQSIAWPPSYNPTDLTVGDFNGDGWADIAVNTNNTDPYLWVLTSGPGRSVTMNGPYSAGPGMSLSIDSGDFNGDGRLDLVRTSPANGGSLQLRYNLGDGRFGGVLGQDYLRYSVTLTGCSSSLVVGDFDNDGLLDVAVSNGREESVDVRFGEDDGTLSSRTVVTLPGTPAFAGDLRAGDFNADGRTDIVVGTDDAKAAFVLTSRDDGTTHGTFVATRVETGSNANAVAAGDFDANGSLDFVTISEFEDQLTLCTNLSGTPRVFGRINVNTAPAAVLRTLFKHDLGDYLVSSLDMDADDLADAIIAERDSANGPFTSLDDFFSRMAASPDSADLFPPTIVPTGPVYGFCTEAQARFMSNLITVRTDQWGVRGRVQFFRDANNDGIRDATEEIITDKSFYMVLDRSQQPIRTVLKRYATAE